jgi:hypothetical protein
MYRPLDSGLERRYRRQRGIQLRPCPGGIELGATTTRKAHEGNVQRLLLVCGVLACNFELVLCPA